LINNVFHLQKSSFSLLTSPYLLAVRKIEWLLSFVKVDEVRDVETTDRVHYVPSIILGDVNLEQFHVLRPINDEWFDNRIAYLKMPIFLFVIRIIITRFDWMI
jgi:hypothetical protein